MKKIAVILSGCGNRDGSELQESLSLLLAIDRRGWQYQCFAPEGLFEVVPHVDVQDDEEEGTVLDMEQRDIFVESARIARGNILPLEQYRATDYDALALPGGMGAARNLSTFAFDGPQMEVIDGVQDAILVQQETYMLYRDLMIMKGVSPDQLSLADFTADRELAHASPCPEVFNFSNQHFTTD